MNKYCCHCWAIHDERDTHECLGSVRAQRDELRVEDMRLRNHIAELEKALAAEQLAKFTPVLFGRPIEC